MMSQQATNLMSHRIPDQKEILDIVIKNSEKPEFRYFIDSCIQKWNDVRPEMDMISKLMDAVCQAWGCKRADVIQNRSYVEARNVFFYLIHKNIKSLSFEIIGEMFGRSKGNVHTGVKRIEFLIERKDKTLMPYYIKIEAALSDSSSDASSGLSIHFEAEESK